MKRALLLFLVVVTLPLDARTRAVRVGVSDSPAAWLRARALPFEALVPLVAGKQVVAFGDATHGTHELYAAKQQLIPLLVERGFRTLAFEAPYAEFAALDDFVTKGEGDPAELIRSAPYWFWDTQEVLDLILWARHANANGMTPPIRIVGIDATEPLTAAARLVAQLRAVDPALAAYAESQYACLLSPPSDLCRSMILSVRPRIPTEHEDLAHAARTIEQGEQMMRDGMASRDAILAENILRLAARGKTIVWGHNEHFGRTDYHLVDPRLIRPAGAYLHDVLGAAYYAIGSVLLEGMFVAVEPTSPSTARMAVQTINAPSPNDWALVFAQARLDAFFLPFPSTLPPFLTTPRPTRIAGSSVLSREQATLSLMEDLPRKFDAVMYIRTSTPTYVRHWLTWR